MPVFDNSHYRRGRKHTSDNAKPLGAQRTAARITYMPGKDPDAGKDWKKEEKMTEDEMVGWHHWFNGHELGQTLRDGEGQGGLERCSPWGHKESDMTEWLNNSTTGNPDKNSPWKSPLRSRDCWDGMEPPKTTDREGNGTQLQYSCLENPMDGGARWAAVHGVAKSRTRLSDFTFTFLHWRRKWQPTPVFLPGESQGRESLVGCCLWGHTESDTTEAT